MAVRTVTVANIIERVRQRADMVGDLFRTDANIVNLINEEWCELYNEVTLARGADFYLATATITTTANTADYSIASVTNGMYELRGIDVVFPNVTITAKSYENAERNIYSATDGYGWTDTSAIWYRIESENIRFMPIPRAAHTVHIRYIKAPNVLSAGDSVDGIAGWESFVVCGVAAKLRDSEETEAAMLMAEKERWRDLIRRAAPQRDASVPHRIADVRAKVAWSGRRW